MRRVYTSLSFLLCLLFLIALSPASAGELRREGFRYEIEFPYSQTIIEGFVVDSSGEGIENASVTGWAHSDNILIDVKTDNNGYFKIVLPGGENHEYSLNINENHYGYNENHPYRGFDNCTVENTIKSGGCHHLRILLNYDPFDIFLPKTSGSLTRGWPSYSAYTGSSSTTSAAWETYKSLGLTEANDAERSMYEGKDGWNVEARYTEERYLTGYGVKWAPGYYTTITTHWYETEPYTVLEKIEKPVYRTETYVSGWEWVPIQIGWFTFYFPQPTYSTRQVYVGTETEWVTRTYYRVVERSSTRQEWVPGYYTTDYSNPIYSTRQVLTGYDIKRMKYTTTTYHYYRTDYTAKLWESCQTSVTVIPKNGYEDIVQLETVASGAQAALGSTTLSFSSGARTTLTMTPHSSTGSQSSPVAIWAYDANGRLVETATYDLTLISDEPSAYSWRATSTSYRYADEPELEEPEPPRPSLNMSISPSSGTIHRYYKLTRRGAYLIGAERADFWHADPSDLMLKAQVSGSGSWEGGGTGTIELESLGYSDLASSCSLSPTQFSINSGGGFNAELTVGPFGTIPLPYTGTPSPGGSSIVAGWSTQIDGVLTTPIGNVSGQVLFNQRVQDHW